MLLLMLTKLLKRFSLSIWYCYSAAHAFPSILAELFRVILQLVLSDDKHRTVGVIHHSARDASQQHPLEPTKSSGPDNYQISVFSDGLIDYSFYHGASCLRNTDLDRDATFFCLRHSPVNNAATNSPSIFKV